MRINNNISDSVYNTIVKGLDPDNKKHSYYKFIIYGYDNTKKQTVGKFAGVMSYIRSLGCTVYFDAVGINPNDKTYYVLYSLHLCCVLACYNTYDCRPHAA